MVRWNGGARVVASRFAVRCVHGVPLRKRCQLCAAATENVVPLRTRPAFSSRVEAK